MHAKDEPNAQRQGSLLHAVFFCALWPDHSRPLQYLKHKHVTPSWDRSHQHRVQHLVVLLALGRAHVDNFPLQVYKRKAVKNKNRTINRWAMDNVCKWPRVAPQRQIDNPLIKKNHPPKAPIVTRPSPALTVRQVLDALECDLKLEGVVEGRWVVQDDHVQHLYFGHGE